MKKDKAIAALSEMPSEFNVEELIERLIFIDKVEAGLDQIKTGKVITHEKVKEISQKW